MPIAASKSTTGRPGYRETDFKLSATLFRWGAADGALSQKITAFEYWPMPVNHGGRQPPLVNRRSSVNRLTG